MSIVGEIEIGGVFLYNQALFVILPFDWETEVYYNLCIATRNHDDYDIGDKYEFEYCTEVERVTIARLKEFIPKD